MAELDEAAFSAFYASHARQLWAYVYRVTGNGADADDIVQEAFLRLLRSGPDASDEERRRFLYRVASNLMIDRWRRRKREPADRRGPRRGGRAARLGRPDGGAPARGAVSRTARVASVEARLLPHSNGRRSPMIRRVLLSCLVAGSFGVGNAWAHHTVPGRVHPVMTTVTITQPVLAGGKPLAPGMYELIVTDESPGQSSQPNETQRWVEFVRNRMVVARELAEVFPHAETPVGTSGSSGAPPAVVQKLKADDFLRVSVNAPNARYLVYLPLSQP